MSLPSRSRARLLGPIPVFVVVVLLALLVGGLLPVGRPSVPTVPVVGDRPATTQEITPTVDPPRVRAVEVCLAVDDSDSEYGSDGSDPTGERYAATHQMLDYLIGLTTPQNVHKVSVVHFGSTAQSSLPLTAVTGADTVRTALQAGPALGATNYPDAIGVCRQTLIGASNPVIVVVGDGDPDLLDGRTVTALFADITRAVADAGPVPVHVLLTVRNGVAQSTMARWQDTGVRTVTDIGADQQLRQQVAHKLIDILGNVIGVLPRPLGMLNTEHTALSVEVPGYAPSMALTSFTPAGSATVRLRDPSGTVVQTRHGAIVTISVRRPAAGPWRVEFVDGDPAQVQVDIAPLQARLLAPSGPVPVGRPLTVSAMVGDGGPLPPALYVGAVIETAGKFYDLKLQPDQAGIWRSIDAAPITQEGSVKIRLLLKAGSDTVLDSSSAPLSAAPTPYLIPDPPLVVADDGAHYGWRLHQGDRPVSDRLLGEPPRAAVTLKIGDEPTQQADYQEDGYWTVPASLLRPGRQVDAQLSSRLVDGTVVIDTVSSTPVVVQPVAWVRVYRALAFAAVALGLMTVSWLVWLLVTTRRRLDGFLEPASRAGPGTSDPLLNPRKRRWNRIGRTSARSDRVIWLQHGTPVERTGLVPWPFDARPSGYRYKPRQSLTSSARH